MIYVVLGMHKSGTTLVSRALHESRIDMGDHRSGGDYDAGVHYERQETKEINKQVLGCGDAHSLLVVSPADVADVPPGLAARAQAMVERLSRRHPDWGFKDPRTCLTYPFWARVLGRHRVILVYRHPSEVWKHYIPARRARAWTTGWATGLRALRAWHRYNAQALEGMRRSGADSLLVNYSALMTGREEWERLREFVGTGLQDVRDPSRYRQRLRSSWNYRACATVGRIREGADVGHLYHELETIRRSTEPSAISVD